MKTNLKLIPLKPSVHLRCYSCDWEIPRITAEPNNPYVKRYVYVACPCGILYKVKVEPANED